MLIPVISLLLLAVAVYVLIRTKPNLFLFDLMRQVCGETKSRQAADDRHTGKEKPDNDYPLANK